MAPGGPSIKITGNSRQDVGDYARQIKPPVARVDTVAAGDDPAPAEDEPDLTGGLCFFSLCACGAGWTDE